MSFAALANAVAQGSPLTAFNGEVIVNGSDRHVDGFVRVGGLRGAKGMKGIVHQVGKAMPPLLEQLPLMLFKSRIVVTGNPLQGIHQGLVLSPKLLVPTLRVKAFESLADRHRGPFKLTLLPLGANGLNKSRPIFDQNLGEGLKQRFDLWARHMGAIE
jgi:hypothetical protein